MTCTTRLSSTWALLLALQLAACGDDDTESSASGDAGGVHNDDGGHQADAGESSSAADAATTSAIENSAPTAYPEQWETVFVDGNPLPEGFQFGRTKSILEQGSTYLMQTLPLPCEVEWDRDVPVKLRDGTVIYVDVLTPPGYRGKLPAIVAWSPYGKALPTNGPTSVPLEWFSGIAKFEGPDAAFWVCRDYAIVNVDTRGAFKSGGDLQVFGQVDAGDGYDVIEWIAEQPWSNGAVGMHGASWLSIAQWNIAATNPPHLKAISPWNGQSDLYRNSIVQGGIPDPEFSRRVGSRFVSENRVESTVGRLDDNEHPLWDDYWADKRPRVEDVQAAAYVGADIATVLHTAGTIDAFRRLGTDNKWLRVNNTNEWYDQYTPENQADLLRFFDHYLKGEDNGWTDTPRVRVAVMDPGGEDKVNVPYESWPLPGTEYRKLYLSPDNKERGTLAADAPATESTVKYDAQSGETTFTITFDEDTQIVGHAIARLYVEADGHDDLDVFALVEKLDAEDNALLPSELAMAYFPMPPPGVPGRLRASMRELDSAESTDYLPVHKFTSVKKLMPGEVVALDIAMMPTAMRWHKGQKLRLTIAGRYVRGGGLPLTTLNQGTHIVHGGGEHASYLQLPVVPWTK